MTASLPYSDLSHRLRAPEDDVWGVHYEAVARRAAGEDLVLLSVGDPDFATPSDIVGKLVEAIHDGRTHYSPPAGEEKLRSAIASLEAGLSGHPLDKDRFVIFPGGTAALYATFACICNPGDEIVVPEPMYIGYKAMFLALGITVRHVSLDLANDAALDIDAVAAAITDKTRAVLVNTPGNPFGNVIDSDTLAALAELTRERGLWLISDEVYSLLAYDVPHVSLLRSTHDLSNVIVIDGLSKSHAMTGWRVGWAFGPPEFAQALSAYSGAALFGCSQFIQDAAAFALEKDSDHVDHMRAAYIERRDALLERLDALPDIGYFRPKAGMFVMVDISRVANDGMAFARMLLDEAGVSTIPGWGFGPSSASYVRLSLTMDVPVLTDAVDRLERMLAGATG